MRRVGTVCGLAAAAACQPVELPGEPVGTYEIVGALVENTCGSAALPARDPLEFEVELRNMNGNGIWIVDSPPGFSGSFTSHGAFRFTKESQYVAIEPDSEMNEPEQVSDYLALETVKAEPVPGCTLAIRETIDGHTLRTLESSMDAGLPSDPTGVDLMAANTIEIAPMPGSDCLKALQAGGGPFLELPCLARYDLEGTLTADAEADGPSD